MEAETVSFSPSIPLFFPFFLTIYVVAYFIIFKNWNPKFRPEAASCAISFSHGTPALFAASFSLISQPHLTFASPNTSLQSAILDFSISYFAMDLIHYLLFYPGDFLFVAHHLATLFVFATCRFLAGHGAAPILALLALAELTSALQNAWTLARARKLDDEFAGKVFDVMSLPFYALYTVARGFMGPVVVYKMWVFYAAGGAEGVIPVWMWWSWLVVVVMAISASAFWVSGLWAELLRERYGMLEKKGK